jgi:hypothetical protein
MAAKVSQRGAKDFYSFTSEEAGHKDERIKNKDKKKKKLLLVISNVERNLSPMFVSSQTFKFFILLLQKLDTLLLCLKILPQIAQIAAEKRAVTLSR